MIDVITPAKIAVDIKEAVGDECCPEMIGRLVQLLVKNGVLSAADLQKLLPSDYQVRTDD